VVGHAPSNVLLAAGVLLGTEDGALNLRVTWC
jgi:hypothetical protein